MTRPRQYAAVLLTALAGAAVYSIRAQSQSSTAPPPAAASTMNHNLVVLDPAHGGPDPGATLGNNILEKDITLAIAARLRTALTAAGFSVVTTRDADLTDPLTTDQRAEIANHSHAVACIVLHATATGSGVHLYTSTLPPSDPADAELSSSFVPTPWETAQAGFVRQSTRLASDINASMQNAHLPALTGQAPLRPLDNLMCPAVAVEIAPLAASGADATPASNADYQQRVAATLTTALQAWREHAEPIASADPSAIPSAQIAARAIAAANAAGLAANHTQSSAPAQKGSAMIPRYQRILFWILAGASLLMALVLLRGCEQAREKLTRHRNETPLAAPVDTASSTVHLALANDADGSINLVDRDIALPTEATARAHALLARLIAEYSYKNATHPLESGPAVDDVFLLDLPLHPPAGPGARPAATEDEITAPHMPGGQLAVINLDGAFADHHPSGVESETLTIQSIIGTLYANFPRIEQVRFLVDGKPRDTLNGHADLMRTYPATNTSLKPVQETH